MAEESAYGVSIDWSPNMGLVISDFEALGLDVRSFREPLKRSIQRVISPSIGKNFELGGRPAWPPLSDISAAQRSLYGFGTDPLVKTGNLQKTAQQLNIWDINSDSAQISQLPEKAFYGAIQDAGAAKGIPERPFLVIQDEDMNDVEEVFALWFFERAALKGFKPGL